MKYILFIISFFFSASTYAVEQVYSNPFEDLWYWSPEEACQAGVSYKDAQTYYYYEFTHITNNNECRGKEFDSNGSLRRENYILYYLSIQAYNPSSHDPVIGGDPITDEQCQTDNGGQQTFTGISVEKAESGFTTSGGACIMAATSDTIAWGTMDDGTTWVNASWVSSSTGEAPSETEEGTQSDFVPPSYMTETTSESAYCQTGSCVTIDGVTYNVDQTAIDSNTTGIKDLTDIEWNPDDTGTATPGTSTDTDGLIMGAGDGTTDSTTGDVVASITDLKSKMQTGFDAIGDGIDDATDELTEEVDPDAIVAGSSIHGDYDALDAEQDNYSVDLMGKFDQLGDGQTSTIAGPVLDYVPDTSGVGTCQPIVFGSGLYSFTIPCSVFDRFRSIFAWVLYFWTAVTIVDLFLASPRRA